MKDSKRIDNKAKSRRIAAYALAGCMAVTAAPITMPAMGPEVVEATTPLTTLGTATYDLTVNKSISATTSYADIAKKVSVDVSTDGVDDLGKWATKASKVVVKDKSGKVLWDSEGNTSTPGTTKIGYGKEYDIDVTFNRTIAVTSDTTQTYNAGGLTLDPTTKSTATITIAVAKEWPAAGMFDSTLDSNQYKYRGSDGKPDVSKTGVFKNDKGWFLVKNGTTVATPESAAAGSPIKETLAKNSNGTWYIGTNGMVDFTKTGIVVIDGTEAHSDLLNGKYYVENGKVNFNKTGLVQQNGVWYNVVKGKVDIKESTVSKIAPGRWIYIDAATADSTTTNYNGLVKNENGTWYVENSEVDFTKDGIIKVDSSDLQVNNASGDAEYLVLGGKVQTDTTGVVFFEGTPYYVSKGLVSDAEFDKKTLVKDVKTGKWYALDETGHPMTGMSGYTGLISNQYGTWYVDAGIVDFEKNGFVTVDEDNEIEVNTNLIAAEYYIEGGKVQTGKNGLVISRDMSDASVVKNVKAGKVTGLEIDNSVVKAPNGKWYTIDKNGEVAPNAFGGNVNGIWVSNAAGIVDFKESGFHKVTEDEAKLKGLKEDDIAYFKDGKLQSDLTGTMALGTRYTFDESLGLPSVISLKNGVVSETVSVKGPTVIKGTDGKWYYVDADGKLDLGKEGVATNSNGTWYVKDGKVNFKKTGLFTDADADKTYYFVNSKLATDKTGLYRIFDGTSADKIYYLEKGVVTGKKTNDNVVKMDNGVWYYVKDDGIVDTTFTGLAENKNGVWYVKNGRVDFSKTGVVSSNSVKVASDKVEKFQTDNLYVVNGKVQFDYTGLAIDDNGIPVYFEKGQEAMNDKPTVVKATDGQWYYVEDGVVDTRYTGLAKNDNGIWYVYKGKVSFSKTGIVETDAVESAKLEAGEYYVANGKMTGDKNGIVSSNGSEYYVQKSAVVKDTELDESVIKVDGTWYCVLADGKVGQPLNGVAANKNGVWYINDKGRVDFKKTGLVDITTGNTIISKAVGEKVYIAGGKFQEDSTCVVVDKDRSLKLYVNNGITTENATSKLTKNKAVKGTDGKMYGVSCQDGNDLLTPNSGYHALAATEDGVVCVDEDSVVVTKVTPQKVTIESTDADSRALFKETPSGEAKHEDVVIIDGKFAKDTTGVVKVGTDRVYIVKGICTKAADLKARDNLVKDSDGTLYFVDDGYTVKTNVAEQLGTYDGAKYYVVYGKVKKVKLNYCDTSAGKVYEISERDGSATLSKITTGNRVIRCSDGNLYLVDKDGALMKTQSNVTCVDGKNYNSDGDGVATVVTP